MTVSIIIPVYNTEAYLPSCIDSILSQSFTDFEVLLVDDGSMDGSGVICDAYAAKDSRIRVFHKDNGGVSSARNLGLDKAKGEWICFVDSDDLLCTGGLQEMVDCTSNQVDLVMAGFIGTVFPEDDVEQMSKERRVITREEALIPMFHDTNRRFEGYIWAKLFRRELIVRKKFAFNPAITIKEDTLFVISYLCGTEKKVSLSTLPVYYYVQRPSSAMESLKDSFDPKYLTSVEAVVQMNRHVESAFPTNRKLQYLSHEEVVNRVYRVLAYMMTHDAVDNGIISQLKRQAFREIGIAHYLDYQFRRNKRRLTRIINRVFKTNFDV